ncbi:TMEM165/GDT1 family protein [Phaeacidiphilus oryzae]|uniref:TMEM165/GDT1 family protein n=1 Tax=Phaeacidiphilus oryzae TaxID=348818 RepID=UPI0005610B38|nr:TMEM165/GDT1 family protein [Phaeacidiphilus oryzae]
MNLSVLLIVFGIIFVAELPDKTALASLMLGTRYRASHVFAGVAAAFAVHVALAVAAGSLLALLPHRWLQGVVAVLFLIGAAVLLKQSFGDGEEEAEEGTRTPASRSFGKVAGTSFLVVLVAEFGDLTQIMTANLAAKYNDPLSVAIGSLLALWAVGGLAIVGGRTLLRWIPMHMIQRIAAAAMLAMAAFSVYEAINA